MEDPAEQLDSKAELDQEEISRLLRENRTLKGRLDELERENRLLKQRNFDLSMRYGRSAENRRQPFEVVFSDSEHGDRSNNDEAEADNNDNDNDNSSMASDGNEVSGAGYSVEESESGRDALSGSEAVGTRAPRVTFAAGEAADLLESAEAAGSSGVDGRERLRDRLQRASVDVSDADRDGSARHGDVESGSTRERRGARDADDRPSATTAAGGSSRRKEAKQLKCHGELEGHAGAIYSTQYSPSGTLIASASFDQTVRVWDAGEQKPVAVLRGHSQSVFDVAWRADGRAVASAGFDRTCVEWDIEAQAALVSLRCAGLVQCLRYSTHNARVVYAGDSSGGITMHDTRAPDAARRLSNDGAAVNTLYCFNDETRLVSGDRLGEIKMWDVRIGRFMRLVSADAQRRALSHISVVRNDQSGTEYMAATSYDNVVRVYDRVDDASVPTPRVIHELRGLRSRNWPVKNAFFDPVVAREKLVGLYNDDYYELDTRSQSEARGLRSALFLLAGSAEPYAYLYKLGTHAKPARIDDKTKRGTRQRLEGHSDRVYAVATHPSEIKACTAGADSTIRLWHIPSAGRLLKEDY